MRHQTCNGHGVREQDPPVWPHEPVPIGKYLEAIGDVAHRVVGDDRIECRCLKRKTRTSVHRPERHPISNSPGYSCSPHFQNTGLYPAIDFYERAELHRLVGELLLAESRDRHGAAEACFGLAIDLARREDSRAWELRATTSLARLWQRQGRSEEARGALAAVYGSYTEGFATTDLVDARVLLESLVAEQASRAGASSPSPEAAAPDGARRPAGESTT